MNVDSADFEERAFWTRQAQKQLEDEQEHAHDALRQARLGAEAFIRRDTTAWARRNTGDDGRLVETADLRELGRIVGGRVDALLGGVRGDGECPPPPSGRAGKIDNYAKTVVAGIAEPRLEFEHTLAADLAAGSALSAREGERVAAHVATLLQDLERGAR